MIRTSVIITSYNNSHNLEQCLNSLINQDCDRNFIDLEIIVVDSGSTDKSIEILNKYKDKIKVILKPQHLSRFSPALARNIGVQNSTGNILIFSDSDCIPPLNWIREVITSFRNFRVDCIIGNRDPDVGCGFGTFIRRYDFILYSNKFTVSKPLIINEENLQTNTPLVLLAGNNFAITREAWDELGGMKTIFKNPSGEDVMMEIELIKNGYNILFNPFIKVIHIHPVILKRLFKRAFQNGEAFYLLSKYSNNFINWRHFAERGLIFNLKILPLNTLIGAILFVIIGFLPFSLIVKLFLVLAFLLAALAAGAIRLSKKLESILKVKSEKETKAYRLSFFKLYCLYVTLLCLKITRFLSFLYYSFSKNKHPLKNRNY